MRVVTGQIGRDPKILIWSSRADANGVLPQLCCIQGDHKRAIICLSFSSTGARSRRRAAVTPRHRETATVAAAVPLTARRARPRAAQARTSQRWARTTIG